jgi:DNA-binding transcriptional LysR family regulator
MRLALKDPLFVRSAKGMLPTPRALSMMGTVHDVLDGMRRLARNEAAFDPATQDNSFRILMTDASHVTLLPHLFAQVRKLAPRVRLEAATITGDIEQEMQAGDADLALGFLPSLAAGFYQQALYQQDWICLANAQHPRLQGRLSKAAYAREEHIGIVSGTGQALLEAALVEQGVTRQIALRLPGFLGLSALLTTTDLLATLPRHIGETLARSANLQLLKCPVQIPTFTVMQHWHARFHHDHANRWLRGVCAGLFSDKPARAPA